MALIILLLAFGIAEFSHAQAVGSQLVTSTNPQQSTVVSGAGNASTGSDLQIIEGWIGEVTSRSYPVPRSIVFISSSTNSTAELPKFVEVDVQAFNALSFLKTLDVKNASWDLKLNKYRYRGRNALEVVHEVTKSELIVVANPDSDWELFHFDGGKSNKIATANKAKSFVPEDLVNWFFSTLKWDGVILDQKGDNLLVGSSSLFLKNPKTQALTALNSENKMSLNGVKIAGTGLLSLSTTHKGYGIFDVVFLGQGISKLPVGTKIIIEKK